MEELRPFEEILKPDFRTTCRGYTLEALHRLAAEHNLSPATPENVRHQFEVARHAFVYSWLYTPLSAAAELYAVMAIELALRLRYESEPSRKEYDNEPGLKALLRIAIDRGWIRDEGFEFDYREPVQTDTGIEYLPIPEAQRQRPTEVVLEVLPQLRNDMAHGQAHMTLNHVSLHLQRATEIINQLFPAGASS
jgi:hypothetical protein